MSAHGGIITSEFLENIRSEKVVNPRIQPDSFATSSVAAPKDKRELEQQIVDSWDRLRERWDAISSRYLKMNLSDSRSKWMIPLLRELGFDPMFNREDIIVDGDQKLRFKLSHKGWNSSVAPMVHMVLPSQDLEEESHEQGGETSRRGRNRSPHDELQTFLNVNRRCRWGIVTNGILLRLLREYFHTTTKGYVEFDVENIFRERSFTDFRALYRMVHASRFLLDKEGLCHLEQFYKESVAAGVSVGENLRRNVKKAIEALGNGFLTPGFAKRMIDDEEFCRAYYSELLRVVYRFLFLLFAEQRAMLPTRDSLYSEEYSITRLREMAEARRGKDEHNDLWEGLKVTFRMLKDGCLPLRVFGYNGSLFEDSEIPILSSLTCKNEDILVAIHHLTLVEEEKVLKRINYLDLGVEEIGSIYESLLDFLPSVCASGQEVEGEKVFPNTFFLDPRGAGRKTTGSYYTHPRLIDELVKSALKPVVERKLATASDKERALLSIKVCDPACGSGAFLIAANNYLARELARLRTNQPEPPDRDVKRGTRDVLQHCIYGVDLNPMAVELTKVSLWINSCVEDLPLNFLDHHIKCGNSLIGTTPELLNGGIPDRAFSYLEGDDKDFAKKIRVQNSMERKQRRMDEFEFAERNKLAKEYASLDALEEVTPAEVEEKKRRFAALKTSSEWTAERFLADAWTADFFWPLNEENPTPPTQAILRIAQKNGRKGINSEIVLKVEELTRQYHFFHWFLEFADVFKRENEGFDCIIGNPPWERIKVQEKEFFSGKYPEITSLPAAKRQRFIENLAQSDPALWKSYLRARRDSDAMGKYVRESGRFPLTSAGDINTYALFAEHTLASVSGIGLVGVITPTGIATDDTNKRFFTNLIMNERLISLYDFENREGLFPSVHRLYKFCLLTTGNIAGVCPVFAFFLTNLDQMKEKERFFKLTADDFRLVNPNTKTCPIFRTQQEADIAIGIYRRIPSLTNDEKNYNPWGVYYMRLVDLDDYADDVYSADDLEERGCTKEGRGFRGSNGENFLPLYESKLIHQFDHRFATFKDCSKEEISSGYPRESSLQEHEDFDFETTPRYWIPESLHETLLKKYTHDKKWLLVYRDVTGATNQHTAISTIIPLYPATRTLPAIGLTKTGRTPFLLANINSIVLDFVSRVKVSGMHLNFAVFRQLPVIPPDGYNSVPREIQSRILDCVVRLTYTSNGLRDFAAEFGFVAPPIRWNDTERASLICELHAIYSHLYGLKREELECVFDSFKALKNNEIRRHGAFVTKMRTLEYYDKFMGIIRPIQVEEKTSGESKIPRGLNVQ
jgi:hypothetical protein